MSRLEFTSISKDEDKISSGSLVSSIHSDLSHVSGFYDIDIVLTNKFLQYPEKKESIEESKTGYLTLEDELSDFNITGDGIIEEQWDIVLNVQARLIELNEVSITLECLVDPEMSIFENRRFERSLLEKVIPLENLYPVLIKIFKRPGEQKIRFIDGKNLVDNSLFERDYFKGIDPGVFNKKF